MENFDLARIDLKDLDLMLVFWDEILETGISIHEEIKNQVWGFAYNTILDSLADPDLSEEADARLKAKLDEYVQTPEVTAWIQTQSQVIAEKLGKSA